MRKHHVALDRPGADDRHLDHQVIELLRAQPWQHVHLRPAFHLEYAQGIRPAQHAVGLGAIEGDAGQIEIQPLVPAQQIKPPP
jgi:hypothetical protein